jgi:urease subunit alpha
MIHRMLEAAEGLPINVGFTGKGQATNPTALIEQIGKPSAASNIL